MKGCLCHIPTQQQNPLYPSQKPPPHPLTERALFVNLRLYPLNHSRKGTSALRSQGDIQVQVEYETPGPLLVAITCGDAL